MSRHQNLADGPLQQVLHDDDPPFHRLEQQQRRHPQEEPRIHPTAAVIISH